MDSPLLNPILSTHHSREDVSSKSSYAEFARPLPAALMHTLKLDKVYTRASGNYLFYEETKEPTQVLDFACGFGTLTLGHNHPEIVEHAISLLQDQTPIHAQLSVRSKTGSLAAALSDEINHKTHKQYITTLANSGAEAVEAAIKHARMAFYQKLDEITQQCEVSFSNLQVTWDKLDIDQAQGITIEGKQYASLDALKLAVLAKNKKLIESHQPVFLAAEKSFHGKSLAALSLTHRDSFRQPFLRNQRGTLFFPWDANEIEQIFSNNCFDLFLPSLTFDNQIELKSVPFSAIAGVFVEPILGEGGAHTMPENILASLAEQAKNHKTPLIFDEIQSGFFRTGEFLASFHTKVNADYYLLGKALGGGIAKISALLIDEGCYQESFGLIHTSTFAEDDYSSSIALKALSICQREKSRVKTIGETLKQQLLQLQRRYPTIIQAVRGKGLMLAVNFKDFHLSQSYGFQLLSRSGYMGYLFCGYLLNNFNIRVATPLSTDTAIRIQPSVYINHAQIEELLSALNNLCQVLEAEDLYKLIEFSLSEEDRNLRALQTFNHGEIVLEDDSNIAEKVGFLTHYIDSTAFKIADPSLAILSNDAIENLLQKITPIVEPLILSRQIIQNQYGDRVSITFVGLGFTSAAAKKALQQGQSTDLRNLCHRAVNLLEKSYHASVVGLGQYTSIITNDGRSIPNSRVKLTTGNSFTIHIGIEAVLDEIKKRQTDKQECQNIDLSSSKMGIIGAGGNISSTYAQVCTRHIAELYLLGGNSSSSKSKAIRTATRIVSHTMAYLAAGGEARSKLEQRLLKTKVFNEMQCKHFTALQLWQLLNDELGEQCPIRVSDSLDDMKQCSVVIVATSDSEAFLQPEHFSANTIVCDISVPLNCSQALINNDKGIKVIFGGVVQLPANETLMLRSCPLDDGQSYACISETLLTGFEKSQSSYSFGTINPKQVEQMGTIGEKHGFLFAQPKVDINF